MKIASPKTVSAQLTSAPGRVVRIGNRKIGALNQLQLVPKLIKVAEAVWLQQK